MSAFEVNTPADRNKLIAMIVLCVLAIASLIYAFGGSFFGGSGKSNTAANANANASPSENASPNDPQDTQAGQITKPVEADIYRDYLVSPVNYADTIDSGPIGGRNIFAFYEPASPTPRPSYVPTPTITPTPTPFQTIPPPDPPPIVLSYISPQSRYAGMDGFKLEVNGSKFTEKAKVVFNGTPLQTTFVSDQRLTANVPKTFLRIAGFGRIRVDTFDGVNFSNQVGFNIQAPPKPTVEYVAMIARKHHNNDIAWFAKKGNDKPISKRLNDTVDGRFKLVSISENKVELEDTRLGFRHTLIMKRPDPSKLSKDTFTGPTRRNNRRRRGNQRNIPGIPNNIPRATPRPRSRTVTRDPTRKKPNEKKRDQ